MHQETPPLTGRRWSWSWAVVAPLIALAAVALTFLVTRPLGGEPQPSFFVIGSTGPGVQIGQIAPGTAPAGTPGMTLTDPDGMPVKLGDFADHPLWVIFWKTDCPPCEAEAADVAAAYAAHRAEGLVVVGIDVWDSSAVVQDYVKRHLLDYPVAIDGSGSFLDAYGVWGAPTHYFIGSDGIIRDRYFGPMTTDLIEESLSTIDPAGSHRSLQPTA